MLFHTQSLLLACLALVSTTFSNPLERREVCNRDNVLRCLIGASATANAYCSSYLSFGTVTSYSTTTTPITIQTATATITPLVKREEPPVKIYARAASSAAPACLAQYSPAASRLSSACNCLTITSSTITTISTAPTSTTTTTVTSTAAPQCLRCNVCTGNSDCRPGYNCEPYFGFSFGDVKLCTLPVLAPGFEICFSICV